MAYGKITDKQREILEYIKSEILNRGFPPAVREICEAVNLKSTSSVHAHLESLEKNGYIRRDPTKPRAIEIVDDNFNLVRREMVNVPVLGRVAAGEPLLAIENVESYFPIPLPENSKLLVGIVPNPYEERRRHMANRKRNIQMKFYVTEEEKRLIDKKMAQLPTRRYGAYLRKMAIDGYIIYTDTTEIKAFTSELSAIGRNINQIAKRINAGGPAYQADMEEIRERLDEIWQLQRRILSSQR